MTEPLQILDKQEAFDSVLDDATDVAHDDAYNVDHHKSYALAKSCASEFKAYIDALNRIKQNPNDTKYVLGDGFPASYALFLHISYDDYKHVKNLYETCSLSIPESKEQIADSNYVFHDSKVRRFVQPLIDILKNKRKHPVQIASKSDVVRFNGRIDPSDKDQAHTLLINRLMLVKDEYETEHSNKKSH